MDWMKIGEVAKKFQNYKRGHGSSKGLAILLLPLPALTPTCSFNYMYF